MERSASEQVAELLRGAPGEQEKPEQKRATPEPVSDNEAAPEPDHARAKEKAQDRDQGAASESKEQSEGEQEQGAGDGDEAAPDDEGGAFDLAHIAELAGVDEETLLDALAVETGQQPASLRELIENYRAGSQLDAQDEELTAAREELQRERDTHDYELHQAQVETRQLVALMAERGALTPAALAHVQQQIARDRTNELHALIDAWPEIRDPDRFNVERERMWKYAKNFGFSRAEYEGAPDHRQLLVLKRLADLEGRLDKATTELRERREERTQARTPARGRGAGGGINQGQNKPNGKGNTRQAQIAQVAELLQQAR